MKKIAMTIMLVILLSVFAGLSANALTFHPVIFGGIPNDTDPAVSGVKNNFLDGAFALGSDLNSVILDLGVAAQANAVWFKNCSESEFVDEKDTLTVWYSDDGKSWIKTESLNVAVELKGEAGSEEEYYTLSFDAVTARFFKVNYSGDVVGGEAASNLVLFLHRDYCNVMYSSGREMFSDGFYLINEDVNPSKSDLGTEAVNPGGLSCNHRSWAIDLSSKKMVNQIVIMNCDDRPYSRTDLLEVWYSQNAESWTKVDNAYVIVYEDSQTFVFTFDDVEARYFKVHYTGEVADVFTVFTLSKTGFYADYAEVKPVVTNPAEDTSSEVTETEPDDETSNVPESSDVTGSATDTNSTPSTDTSNKPTTNDTTAPSKNNTGAYIAIAIVAVVVVVAIVIIVVAKKKK